MYFKVSSISVLSSELGIILDSRGSRISSDIEFVLCGSDGFEFDVDCTGSDVSRVVDDDVDCV